MPYYSGNRSNKGFTGDFDETLESAAKCGFGGKFVTFCYPPGYLQARQLGVYILAASLEPNRVPGTTLPTLGASLISKRQNDALREWLETNSNQSPHWSKDDAYADLPKVRFPKGKVLVHV